MQCVKCGADRKSIEVLQCPECGVYYAKAEAALIKKQQLEIEKLKAEAALLKKQQFETEKLKKENLKLKEEKSQVHDTENIDPIKNIHDKTDAYIAYGLHLFSLFLFPLILVAIIVNYIKKGKTEGYIKLHHCWMIDTFWSLIIWGILGTLVVFFMLGTFFLPGLEKEYGVVSVVAIFGYYGYGILFIWWLYRNIKGIIYLSNEKAP